jgi:hypothetical protein
MGEESIMRSVLFLLSGIPLFCGSAFGWGCEGHQMIALIARAHLTPAVSGAVDMLLRENPIPPELSRFCKDRPSDLMADSATWADDRRGAGDIGDWHYIDIPMGVHPDAAHEKDAMEFCHPLPDGKPGCVVTALEYEMAILRDKSQPAQQRTNALRYVIHFVADLSQPLHTLDHRGGNCTEMKFFSEERPENLHAIWDSKIIRHDLDAKNATQVEYAKALDTQFSSNWRSWGESKIDILAWTLESHALVSAVVYGDLKPPIPPAPPAELKEQPACTAERQAVAALHISINDEYVTQALPAIRQQLAKAGYRLAEVLNQSLN